MKKILLLMFALLVVGGTKVNAQSIITKTPIILTGGKFNECFTPGTYGIQMQSWRSFIAYKSEEGVAFDENSTMVFDMVEPVANGSVRVTFTFSDETTQQCWWCLGIGTSADDTSTPYGHDFDNSTFWLKKGLGNQFESKKSLKITKVTVDNFGTDDLFEYQVRGGTICGQPMNIQQNDGVDWGKAQVFGGYSGTFSATDAFTNVFQLENFAVGDYQKIVIKFAEAVPATGGWNLNNNSGLTGLAGKTEIEFALDGTAISDFTIFNMDANPDPIKISEVYFYKEISEIEATPGNEVAINKMTSYHKSGDTYVTTGYTPNYRINEATNAAYFGVDWNGENLQNYTDVSGCSSIRVYQAASTPTVRAFFFNAAGDYQQQFNFTWNAAGYYELDLATVEAAVGNLKLISIRPQSGQTSSVTKMVVLQPTKIDYVLSGAGTLSASATAALADASATVYDATGVTTGTGIELTPANPNALFIANEGVLANANNVIVEGVCDNLVLADGYPFEAPADFKATTASYSTTINADAKAGTLCLPFEADIPVGVTAYTLKYVSGENAAEATEVTGTIPANTPVLLNGAGDATFFAEDADVDADADNTFEALTGVFARTQVPDGSYVLQNGDDGIGFYVVEPTAAIWAKPFRAYMTALSNNAKIRVINADGEATGITGKEAPAAAKDGAIYTVAGQRVAKPTKGFYLQDGKTYYAK